MKKLMSLISAFLVMFAFASPIAKSAEFFKSVSNYKFISEEMVKKYAPNVVEGTSKLSNWAKNL